MAPTGYFGTPFILMNSLSRAVDVSDDHVNTSAMFSCESFDGLFFLPKLIVPVYV